MKLHTQGKYLTVYPCRTIVIPIAEILFGTTKHSSLAIMYGGWFLSCRLVPTKYRFKITGRPNKKTTFLREKRTTIKRQSVIVVLACFRCSLYDICCRPVAISSCRYIVLSPCRLVLSFFVLAERQDDETTWHKSAIIIMWSFFTAPDTESSCTLPIQHPRRRIKLSVDTIYKHYLK